MWKDISHRQLLAVPFMLCLATAKLNVDNDPSDESTKTHNELSSGSKPAASPDHLKNNVKPIHASNDKPFDRQQLPVVAMNKIHVRHRRSIENFFKFLFWPDDTTTTTTTLSTESSQSSTSWVTDATRHSQSPIPGFSSRTVEVSVTNTPITKKATQRPDYSTSSPTTTVTSERNSETGKNASNGKQTSTTEMGSKDNVDKTKRNSTKSNNSGLPNSGANRIGTHSPRKRERSKGRSSPAGRQRRISSESTLSHRRGAEQYSELSGSSERRPESESDKNLEADTRGKTRHVLTYDHEHMSKNVTDKRLETRDRTTDGATSICKTCGAVEHSSTNDNKESKEITEDEIKAIRTKMVIDLLMKKMRLEPNDLPISSNALNMFPKLPILPRAILDQTKRDNERSEEEDDFYARDQQAIVAGDDMDRDCIDRRATGCYKFRFNGKVTAEVEKAELWVYKTPDRNDINGQVIYVYELERQRNTRRLKRRNLIARHETRREEGWVTLNVTRAVRQWVHRGHHGKMLAVRCKTCMMTNHRAIFGVKHDYKPLLITTFVDRHDNGRTRRSATPCDPSTECCRRPLVINFDAIGLSYIRQPLTLAAGYCYGTCRVDDDGYYNHTTLMQHVIRNGNLNLQQRRQLKPCCVPVELRDTFILTTDPDNGTIMRKLLPKVIVARCGCV